MSAADDIPPHFNRLAYPFTGRFTLLGRAEWMRQFLAPWALVGCRGDALLVEPRVGVARPPA